MRYRDPSGLKLKSWMEFITISVSALLIWWLSGFLNLRLDLTEDQRYTLSEPSRNILRGLTEDVYIQVYLDGDMPVQFRKLRRSAREMLDEFRILSGKKVDYEFINPSAADGAEERNIQYKSLLDKGLNPINIQDRDEEGGSSQKIIFPGMIVNCNGIEVPVNFLKNNPTLQPEVNLLHSAEGLEYEMIQTISIITSDTIHKVAFIEGHNEIGESGVADITLSLAKYFTIDRGVIGGKQGILNEYAAIIIAGPESTFDDKDKLVIDQYIMNGGRVVWLVDEVEVSDDSLLYGETVALYRPLGIEDMLFRYGVRINPSIVQDLECLLIPMKVVTGTQQQIVPVPWLYYPRLIPSEDHPVTRNLNRVAGKFVNFIDTVGFDPLIKKSILLSTSATARTVNPPLLISLREVDETPDINRFNRSALPVAVLLEGKFQSAFRNRPVADLTDDKSFRFKPESVNTRMIVIADGDIIRNDVRRVGSEETPIPLGQDRYTLQMYGNTDFLVNSLNYLVDYNGLMELRSREIKLRLLNKNAIRDDRPIISLVNTFFPVILTIFAGMIYNYSRKRRYIKTSR